MTRLGRWFSAQPIHRKLWLLALTITTVPLVVAMTGLTVAEVVRARASAQSDVESLASVLADTSSDTMASGAIDEARETLKSVRLRYQVRRACLFLPDERLFAGISRPGEPACPSVGPAQPLPFGVASTQTVLAGGRTVGRVYVERDLRTIETRLMAIGITAAGMFLLAAALAAVLAGRLQRTISRPIMALADVARSMGEAQRYEMPPIEAPHDEVGELVHAFEAMVKRVSDSSRDLQASNDALRREVAERQHIEQEHQRLLRREREANRFKDEFLATVSHELRTPLNAIVGWTRVLARGKPDDATLTRALASLDRNAQAQAQVIDDLIDIARIAQGKLRVQFEPIDLRSVVEASVDVVRPVADQKPLTLRLRLEATPCVISGDRNRLQQVIWNLLANAVKFTPAGGSVFVEVGDTGDACVVSVRDSGVGIDPEFLPHLFERFRQADASITREYTGLGIGLAIAHELIELHQGTITATSEGRGRGSTFTVTLPALRPDQLPGTTAEGHEVMVPTLSGVRALVVDDNLDALALLESTLGDAGADVRASASAVTALAGWRQGRFDVLVCDLAMPGMSGYELLSQIREIDERQGRLTPAIAVTAQATEEQIARSLRAGFAAHITKPFDPSDVIRRIAAALQAA